MHLNTPKEPMMADEIESSNPEQEVIQVAGSEVFRELDDGSKSPEREKDLDFIRDIPVQLSVELGRTKISIKNLLQLAQGSIVELDAAAGDLMDILVNGTMIAKGEVVVVNEKFGVRLTEIITPVERIRKLNK
ncbi:flagellar motor switch protein FliN [Polynucleobacter sp. AP-Feld-500C-C5]|nr:flagellar motor switch protein FliN [Polynucleobacter sp. AP-Feld-500C-C5]MBU3633144.1 flagellar motor switch protein FliN [Polynucleobacter sp. AP-Feld-500C-C5]